MNSPRYVRDPAGLARLLVAPQMGHCMQVYGLAGAAMFASIAPHRTGRLAASARVSGGVDATPTPRRVAHVVADRDYAASVEFGNSRGSKGHHTLAAVADTLEAATRR